MEDISVIFLAPASSTLSKQHLRGCFDSTQLLRLWLHCWDSQLRGRISDPPGCGWRVKFYRQSTSVPLSPTLRAINS